MAATCSLLKSRRAWSRPIARECDNRHGQHQCGAHIFLKGIAHLIGGNSDLTHADLDPRNKAGGPLVEQRADGEGFGNLLARAIVQGQLGGEMARQWLGRTGKSKA